MSENLIYDMSAYPKLLNDLSNYDLDQDVMYRLSIHLERTYKGNHDIYRTPIAKDYGEELILSELDKVFIANKHKLNSTLIDLENSNRVKFGPRSISIPWPDRLSSFTDSFGVGDIGTSYSLDPIGTRNFLRPISLNKALTLLKNNTNSGLPYYTSKGKVKNRAYDNFSTLLNKEYPCILFTRSQEQSKTRDVWGYPIADTLNEARIYSPLLEYQRKLDYRSALTSPDKVAESITKLIMRCNTNSNLILISVDFSAYDRSVKFKLQEAAFNYIKSLYQSNYHSDIDYIFKRFNTIGIVTPTGIFKGNHGVPSGSTFTNEVDSIVQAMLSMSTGLVKYGDFQVQGDDGVYLIPSEYVESFYKIFESAGLVLNKDKSYLSRDFAVYLQCLFHKDYYNNGIIGGIYPIYRALNRILFQERWSTFEDYDLSGKDYYSIRTLCILENCKYHPLFKEFVAFILKYDKYSLDPSDQGITNYVKMISLTQGGEEILNQQYGSKPSGLRSFESYKLVRDLS